MNLDMIKEILPICDQDSSVNPIKIPLWDELIQKCFNVVQKQVENSFNTNTFKGFLLPSFDLISSFFLNSFFLLRYLLDL